MRPIDADDLKKSLNNYVFNDPACPMHIAATVDQYIDFAPTVGKWIQCKDRLPDEGTEVLAVCNGFDGFGNPKRMYVLAKLENGSWIETWCLSTLAFDVVEWIPLPDLNGGGDNDHNYHEEHK